MRRDTKALERGMDELSRRCRDAGMSVTPQRLAVYRALLQADDHPSPEALCERVRTQMPSLSLATIYKTLTALEALGLVHEVTTLSERRRYDANLDPHHHLVCTGCKKVMDFYDDGLDAIRVPKKVRGFVPRSVTVRILGLCTACARSA